MGFASTSKEAIVTILHRVWWKSYEYALAEKDWLAAAGSWGS